MLQERPGGIRGSQESPEEADNRASKLEAGKLEGRGSRVEARGLRLQARGFVCFPRSSWRSREDPGVQGGTQSSRKVAEEALGSRGEAVELDKRERQRKAVWAAAGWTGGFLVLCRLPKHVTRRAFPFR